MVQYYSRSKSDRLLLFAGGHRLARPVRRAGPSSSYGLATGELAAIPRFLQGAGLFVHHCLVSHLDGLLYNIALNATLACFCVVMLSALLERVFVRQCHAGYPGVFLCSIALYDA